ETHLCELPGSAPVARMAAEEVRGILSEAWEHLVRVPIDARLRRLGETVHAGLELDAPSSRILIAAILSELVELLGLGPEARGHAVRAVGYLVLLIDETPLPPGS